MLNAPCALVYQSEMDFVSRCILDCPNIETGGELFGFWTATGIPVVLLISWLFSSLATVTMNEMPLSKYL